MIKTKIQCQDGYTLTGVFYPAHQETLKAYPILLCPATGITSRFYQQFCQWLSTQGYAVLSFDFRGIGESLQGKVKHSKASIVQWGQLDIPAAIEHLLALTQSDKVILVGHSAGGQLLGIASNYNKVEKVVAIAGSTGFIKQLKGRTKLLAPFMFKAIFPLARYTLGYGPTKAIGMGENLPKDVAQQWAQFCSNPGYVANAIGKTVAAEQDYHAKIHCPVTAIWATDDEIATEANVLGLLQLYPNAPTQMIELNPQQHGHQHIGHMLMFRTSHQNLWPLIEQHIAA